MSKLSALLADVRSQWQANPRLRLGVAAIAGVVWLWAVLVLIDVAHGWRAEAEAARMQVEQWRPLAGQSRWADRADEVRKQSEVVHALQWTAPSPGAAEARLQDTLRNWADKAGLQIIELTVLQGAAGEAAASPAGAALRVRLVADFNRAPLLALLAELQGTQPMVMVDALRLKPALTPARAEMELRVQMRLESAGAEEAKP